MKKCAKILYRISSLALAVLTVISISLAIPVTAQATTLTTGSTSYQVTEKSYDIAVVFDNSGSMYDNEAWCRAKYAMEVFASMLDYDDGDKLRIYPMWGVTTDGSQPGSGGSYSAIEIRSKADIDKISNLYTVAPSSTPFAPALEAHAYMKTSTATDKWIVVLTDGEFNQIERGVSSGTLSASDLKNRLLGLATNDIKVQYLGFAGASELKSEEAKNFYAKKSTDTSLKDDLIGICNAIFQRSILPDNRLKGQTLKLDMSMKNLIVFAQGSNARIESLVDASGNRIRITLDSGQRKWSSIAAGGEYRTAPVDDTLAGQVVTFAACPAGEYTLNYSGADAIQIFYEPDVAVKVTLTDSDGQVVDGAAGQIVSGEYTINSIIVDSKTGEDVTSHELLGKDVSLETKVTQSTAPETKVYANGSKIDLTPDAATDIVVVGTYLKDYTITSDSNHDLAWLKGISVVEPAAQFVVEANVLQEQSWFKIKKHDEWKPIRVTMTLDGQPLNDAQLAAAQPTVTTSGNLRCRCEAVPGASAYDIYLAQDENGKFIEPESGEYTLSVSATHTSEYGQAYTDKDEVSFDIQWYSKFWQWLLWVVIAIILLIIIMMILNHPTMPSAAYLKTKNTCQPIKINGTSVALSTDLYPGELRCEAKACTPLKVKGKTTAAFEVKRVVPNGGVNWFEIDGTRFKKVSGKYVNADGDTVETVKPKLRISDDTELKWNTNRHTATGRVFINHNE